MSGSASGSADDGFTSSKTILDHENSLAHENAFAITERHSNPWPRGSVMSHVPNAPAVGRRSRVVRS